MRAGRSPDCLVQVLERHRRAEGSALADRLRERRAAIVIARIVEDWALPGRRPRAANDLG